MKNTKKNKKYLSKNDKFYLDYVIQSEAKNLGNTYFVLLRFFVAMLL